MTDYKQADIAVVDFGFSEGGGYKKRPVLIISSDGYNRSRHEVIVAAVTSNIKRVLFADTKIEKYKEAGLVHPSLVTGIIRTIKTHLIICRIGSLSKQDFQSVQKNLQKIIGCSQ